MNIPTKYLWLAKEGAPRHMVKALELYGVTEVVGSKNNPTILEWAKELDIKDYTQDSIPWCGLFMAIVMKRAGREPVKQPLWAQNWTKFGVPVPTAMLGDVLVFGRDGGGHVGIYVGEDKNYYFTLGGNQGDQVCIVRILKSRLIEARRPAYKAQPANIRRVHLTINGDISNNEA